MHAQPSKSFRASPDLMQLHEGFFLNAALHGMLCFALPFECNAPLQTVIGSGMDPWHWHAFTYSSMMLLAQTVTQYNPSP